MYGIGDKLKVRRISKDKLRLEIGGEKVDVFTEDLAALVREELPKDRAKDLFSEIEERMIKQGKAQVRVQARKNIKKGEEVCFVIDINKYQDGSGIRTTDSGIIF